MPRYSTWNYFVDPIDLFLDSIHYGKKESYSQLGSKFKYRTISKDLEDKKLHKDPNKDESPAKKDCKYLNDIR